MKPYFLKRILDLAISLPLYFTLSPLLIFTGAMIYGIMGNPVFFRQKRPGAGEAPFVVYKFRTMRDQHDANGNPLLDGVRLTTLGKILRRTSLDELPELINVIGGEMSIVGPRPLLMEYLNRYSREQRRRHEVKPGLTGWAQINGRNALSWEQKFAMDVWYVDNQSLRLDLKIIAITLSKVIKGDGINQPGHATMEEFWG